MLIKRVLKNLCWRFFPQYLFKKYQYNGRWAEIEQHIVSILLDKENETVDVGANYGSYTTVMSLWSKYVHAFEPNHQCIENLHNLALPNVKIYPNALSSSNGVSEYFIPIENGVQSTAVSTLESAILDNYDNIDTRQVNTQTLDFLSHRKINFVKIDVEGHEMDVLLGGKKLIEKQQPVFMVEAEERHRPGVVQELGSFFKQQDYHGYYIFRGKMCLFESFTPSLQDVLELERPVSRTEMNYVNNFIFLPSKIDQNSVIQKIEQRLLHLTNVS